MAEREREETHSPAKIHKEKVSVVVLTERFRIEGTTHYVPQARLSDLMNRSDVPFLPITDASVFSHDGHLVMEASFISLNKSRVVLITTLEADDEN